MGQAMTGQRPATTPRAGRREWIALATLMLPVLVVSIDNTALAFAVPQLSMTLAPSAAALLWIVDIYPLVLAGLLMTMGVLGDRVGRRRLLLIGTAGFAAMSLYAAFSPSTGHLIAARGLLGFFGAMLMPSTLSLIRNLFLDDHQRRLAIAIWATSFAGGASVGPIIGGWLVEHFWWGAIFLISVPAAIPLLILGPILLPESRNLGAGRLDPLGVALSVAAMFPFAFGVKHIAGEGFDLLGASALLVAALSAVFFVRRQLRQDDPLLDLRLFTRPVFTASITANFLSIFAFAGLVFFLTQHLQFVEGKSPIEAALTLIPGAVASVLMGLGAVALARVIAIRHLIPAGLALGCLGYVLASTISVGAPGWLVVVVFLLVGSGVGLAETLTNDAILASVPAERAGAASGISETAYELGTALGVAVLGSLLAWTYRTTIVLPDGLPPETRASAENTIGTAVAAAEGLPAPLAEATRYAAQQAFDAGVSTTALVGAVLSGLTTIGVWVVLRRAARSA